MQCFFEQIKCQIYKRDESCGGGQGGWWAYKTQDCKAMCG